MQSLLAVMEQNFSGSLADFKAAAEKEFNGTKFIALKQPSGRRFILVACFTGANEISKARNNVRVEDIKEVDWTTTSLTEVIAAALLSRRFVCLREGGNNNPTALALISADPVSISKVEELLGLSS